MRRRAAAPATGRPLLVSDRMPVVDALLDRLPEGAPVPEVAAEPRAARRSWSSASVVLVDPDLLEPLLRSRPPSRPGVALLLTDDRSHGDDSSPDWSAGVRLGIERALDLDEAARWLAATSASPRAAAPASALSPELPGAVVTVTGAVGGCGASSLAVAISLAGARRGLNALLVDLDPIGGGLDITLDLEASPGPRWPQVAAMLARGETDERVLHALPALPQGSGGGSIHLLSAGRPPGPEDPADPMEVAALLRQAAQVADLLVIDLPRQAPADLLPPGPLLLVVPNEVRACAAAAARVRLLGATTDIRLVVREGTGSLDDAGISTALGCPVVGRLRAARGLTADVDRGIPPGSRRRSLSAQLSEQLLDGVLAGQPMPAVR
jgi:secretion/DNA translocation related CpaE-like protein